MKLIRYALSSSHYIFVPSTSLLKILQDIGDGKLNIHIISNGFDEKQFYPLSMQHARAKLGLPIDKIIILNVGTLEDVKGQKYLIEAVLNMKNYEHNLYCIILGSGEARYALERQINDTAGSEYIKLLGSVPHEDILFWMNACDIFILPSLRESFGIVQIEAMACGKPVIATYNGGSEEIITPGENGLLCEPGDASKLAETILEGLRIKWNENKIRESVKKYSWLKVSRDISKTYEFILKKGDIH